MAAFCDAEGHERLIESGVVDALAPIASASDAARHSVIAALALGNLIGSDEKRFGALPCRAAIVRMVAFILLIIQ